MQLQLFCLAFVFHSLSITLAEDWPAKPVWDGYSDPIPSQMSHYTFSMNNIVPNQTFVYPCHLDIIPITEEEDLESRKRAHRLYQWVKETGEKWPYLDPDSLAAADVALFLSRNILGRERKALLERYKECRHAPFADPEECDLGHPPVAERLRRAQSQLNGAHRDLRIAHLQIWYVRVMRNSIALNRQHGCLHIVVRRDPDEACVLDFTGSRDVTEGRM